MGQVDWNVVMSLMTPLDFAAWAFLILLGGWKMFDLAAAFGKWFNGKLK